jgi:hypothetical protein
MGSSEAAAGSPFSEPRPDERSLSSYAHRQTIGLIGMLLPPLLVLLAGWRPTDGLPQWEPLGSVSAYFYTGAGPAFCGALVALAVFFFTYRGYDNPYGAYDRLAGVVAGAAAVIVVLFPTGAPGDLLAPGWWTPLMGRIHLVSGAILFASFGFFCIQFRRTRPGTRARDLTHGKRMRNRIYAGCGWGIAICLVWLVVAWFDGASIFLPEVLTLEFFAASWLVKGRAYEPAARYARRSLKAMENAWAAARGERG